VVNWRDVLERLPEAVPAEDLPVAIGQLEVLRAQLSTRLLLRSTSRQIDGGRRQVSTPESDRLLTVSEVAELLRVSEKTVYRRKRELGPIKVGGRLRFKESRIRRQLERGRC
jgi:excisionase family DNA binding protein